MGSAQNTAKEMKTGSKKDAEEGDQNKWTYDIKVGQRLQEEATV